MFEGTYTPPLYLDLYNFHDGAQKDIFENTTNAGSSVSGSAVGRAVQPPQPPSSSSSEPTAKSSSDASPPSQETKGSSHSRDYPRNEVRAHAEERALRRTWGAYHRRSVGKHHP